LRASVSSDTRDGQEERETIERRLRNEEMKEEISGKNSTRGIDIY
jgi:hypothetical protein